MRLPRRYAPRNDKVHRITVHPAGEPYIANCHKPAFPVSPADKLRPSRRLQLLGGGKEASEDSTAVVRQARLFAPNNADGALSAAVPLNRRRVCLQIHPYKSG